MNDNTNFLTAIVLCVLIIAGFQWFYNAPRQKALQEAATAGTIMQKPEAAEQNAPAALLPRAEALKASKRITLANDKIHGSLNVRGARLDDITLARYRETVDPNSAEVTVFSPAGSAAPHYGYYAEMGWLSPDLALKLPNAETEWQADGGALAPGKPLTLRWNNGAGLSFERSVALDENYLFTITEKVTNSTAQDVTLMPFALISRHGTPQTKGVSVLHEGPLGVLDGQLKEFNYKKLKEKPLQTLESTGGWLGVTDMYWLSAFVPPQDEKLTARFLHSTVGTQERYQTDMQLPGASLKPGASLAKTIHLFVGAKEVAQLDAYGKQLGAPMFDKAVDFGWFYFIAKPFFYLLEFLYQHLGNYGLAIIVFTILLRGAFFPLSESSYRSMARMKELQPEMERIKQRFGNDPMKMNEEMAAIYRREKLNPMGGCLPVFVQIPVFFALYKVLLVSIEMRHAPFYGWINDLAAPDHTNLFNLFGLLPFTPPGFLHLGAWPLLMGITMFIQQKLSPPPPDKTTAQVFTLMPIMFTFLLANMSAGLVIYWTLSNILAIAQQKLINHKVGKAKKA